MIKYKELFFFCGTEIFIFIFIKQIEEALYCKTKVIYYKTWSYLLQNKKTFSKCYFEEPMWTWQEWIPLSAFVVLPPQFISSFFMGEVLAYLTSTFAISLLLPTLCQGIRLQCLHVVSDFSGVFQFCVCELEKICNCKWQFCEFVQCTRQLLNPVVDRDGVLLQSSHEEVKFGNVVT